MQLHEDGYIFRDETVLGLDNLIQRINDGKIYNGWDVFQVLPHFERNEYVILWKIPTESAAIAKIQG